MLTTISKNPILTGYQGHQIIAASKAVDSFESPENPSLDKDRVEISRQAKKLRTVYDEKEQTLEERYYTESKQLEQEYLQEKKKLEQEFSRKKQNLGVSIYA